MANLLSDETSCGEHPGADPSLRLHVPAFQCAVVKTLVRLAWVDDLYQSDRIIILSYNNNIIMYINCHNQYTICSSSNLRTSKTW